MSAPFHRRHWADEDADDKPFTQFPGAPPDRPPLRRRERFRASRVDGVVVVCESADGRLWITVCPDAGYRR